MTLMKLNQWFKKCIMASKAHWTHLVCFCYSTYFTWFQRHQPNLLCTGLLTRGSSCFPMQTCPRSRIDSMGWPCDKTLLPSTTRLCRGKTAWPSPAEESVIQLDFQCSAIRTVTKTLRSWWIYSSANTRRLSNDHRD